MKYRKKPVVIEAWQITQVDLDRPEWVNVAFAKKKIEFDAHGNGILISTLEGQMFGDNGNWLIKGVKGEFYPCKPDIFKMTYEPAE